MESETWLKRENERLAMVNSEHLNDLFVLHRLVRLADDRVADLESQRRSLAWLVIVLFVMLVIVVASEQ